MSSNIKETACAAAGAVTPEGKEENRSSEPPGTSGDQTPLAKKKSSAAGKKHSGHVLRRHFQENWYIYVLFFLSWLVCSLSIYFHPKFSSRLLEQEWRLRYTLRADYDYSYSDDRQYQQACRTAAENQPAVYMPDHRKNQQIRQEIRRRIEAFYENPEPFFKRMPGRLPQFSRLLKEPQAVVVLWDLVDRQLSMGVMGGEQAGGDGQTGSHDRILILNDGGEQQVLQKKAVSGPREAELRVARQFARAFELPEKYMEAFLEDSFIGNLIFNPGRTEEYRRQAVAQVLRLQLHQNRGSDIIRLSDDELDRLRAYEKQQYHGRRSWRDHLVSFFSPPNVFKILLVGIFLLIYGVILFRIHAVSRNRLQHLSLCAIVIHFHCFFICLGSFLHGCMNQSLLLLPAFLPTALMVAIIASLLGGRTAISTIIFTAVLIPLQVPVESFAFELSCVTFFIGIVGLLCFQKASHRMDYLSGGLITGTGVLVISLFLALELEVPWAEIRSGLPRMVVCSFINGMTVALSCLVLLPLFEYCFGLATPSTLLELCDASQPLLLRLQREAPGTYQHSSNVAIIASAAAREIGANPTLTRAMALYHDVGKLYRPEYFAENMHNGSNLHDELSPEESIRIVREHVAYGLELAYRYHLKRPVYPAIERHHGSSVMQAFYEKARRSALKNGDDEPDVNHFRYPYPLPEKKEVVLLSLADSCEAAVRSMFMAGLDYHKVTEEIIQTIRPAIEEGRMDSDELVQCCLDHLKPGLKMQLGEEDIRKVLDRIFLGKWEDGQLARADLTLRELEQVKQVFLKNFLDMYHTRPQYPEKLSRG